MLPVDEERVRRRKAGRYRQRRGTIKLQGTGDKVTAGRKFTVKGERRTLARRSKHPTRKPMPALRIILKLRDSDSSRARCI